MTNVLEAAPPTVSAPPLPRRVQGQQVTLAETARCHWHVKVPADHTAEDCVSPAYLWLRHDLLKPGHRVEMVHEDFKFLIEALVVKIDRDTQSVFTRIINAVDFSDQAVPVADLSQAVVENVPGDGWRVVLGHAVLARGFERKADATGWLDKKKRGEVS